jgi:small subunit ribosomal protein S16
MIPTNLAQSCLKRLRNVRALNLKTYNQRKIRTLPTCIPLLPIPLNSAKIMVCLNLPDSSGNKDHKSVLTIRLARTGARKQPHYRVVVIEKERARNGRPVEIVGTYNPRTNPASVELKRERITHWVSKGAQLSDRVSKLLSKPAPATTEPAA